MHHDPASVDVGAMTALVVLVVLDVGSDMVVDEVVVDEVLVDEVVVVTDVVVALSHAEMTLQATTAIRDRVVQAYQDIMRMPI